MAESEPNTDDITKPHNDVDIENVGHFAHRLSLDVTNDALAVASHRETDTEPSQSQNITDDEVTKGVSTDQQQSLPNTTANSSTSLEDCNTLQKHRNPVVRIRDASRTFVRWLRLKSKSINHLNGESNDTSWRLWRKSRKSTHGESLCKRALPPVPVSGASAEAVDQNSVEDYDVNHRLNHSLEGLMPGEAYMADDDDEDDIDTFASNGGSIDFAASIEKVKNYGWYWGPISGEAAERLLSNEPDGSFVVRDSSDDHYIFSLTFKLNGTVRHVRIEHDQGNFSFGSFTKFKSNTIVDFIENAVEHSRSGRYLFFLHRRPVFGPMRVQLLHPVSRFKQVQSLQHLCRFVILKLVPRDLLFQLPVPKRLREYLNTPFYYCEAIADWTDETSAVATAVSTAAMINDTELDELESQEVHRVNQTEGESSSSASSALSGTDSPGQEAETIEHSLL